MAASTGKSSTRYSTDPYGIIERGVPGGGAAGPSFSVGRVGTPVASLVSPGRSFGSGVGGRLSIPVGKNEPAEVKKKASGGSMNVDTPDYQDISQENPERIAAQEARRAAVRARNAEMKNALKARSEARRPAIEAAKAERQAIADRNLAMQKDLPLGSVISGLTQSMINQGASPEQRSAAVKELMAAHRAAPRDVRGNTDMSALVSLLGKYTTQDQMNAALAERGRTGRFNAFDTYKTGLADFNQRAAADVAADQKARADIERSFRTQWGHAVRPQPAQEAQMGYMPPPQVSYMPPPPPPPIPRYDFETGQPLPPSTNVGFGQAMGSGLGGMFGNAASQTPSNFVSAPRQLTPEEAMQITSYQQPMALPGGTGYDANGNIIRQQPRNIFSMFGSALGAPQQPQQLGTGFTIGGLLGRPMGIASPPPTLASPPLMTPMAYKKGGAVKAVWDKKRPKDLGEPNALSVKKKAAAKRRAKAAGRPYPNLIDNMAAARKKGK